MNLPILIFIDGLGHDVLVAANMVEYAQAWVVEPQPFRVHITLFHFGSTLTLLELTLEVNLCPAYMHLYSVDQ